MLKKRVSKIVNELLTNPTVGEIIDSAKRAHLEQVNLKVGSHWVEKELQWDLDVPEMVVIEKVENGWVTYRDPDGFSGPSEIKNFLEMHESWSNVND